MTTPGPTAPGAPRQSSSALGAAAVVLAGLAIYGLLNHRQLTIVAGYLATSRPGPAANWVGYYALSGLAYLWLLATRWRTAAALLLGATFVSGLVNFGYDATLGGRLTGDVVGWLMDESGNLGNAFDEYRRPLLLAVGKVAGLLLLLLGWRGVCRANPRCRWWRTRSPLVSACVAALYLGLVALCHFKRPPQLPVECNAFVLAAGNALSPPPSPRGVETRPQPLPAVDKVILVVDESVRADSFARLVRPSLAGLPLLDYGEAAATVNCSAGSNTLLRWGLHLDRLGQRGFDAREGPYLWAFAHRAGYRTVLIDGQTSRRPQNVLLRQELRQIDEVLPLGGGDDIDSAIARELSRRLRTADRELIYVVLHGTHFPYERNYPAGTVAADASRLEKYEASIRYTTVRFFEKLRAGADFSRAVLIYTSDHGQRLEEGRLTHCNRDAVWQEYAVPLVVVTGVAAVHRWLAAGVETIRNRASHEQIFPTLLFALGFPGTLAEGRYPPPLAEPWGTYHVLVDPQVPFSRDRYQRVNFSSFDHFPFREGPGTFEPPPRP